MIFQQYLSFSLKMSEITKTKDQRPKTRDQIIWLSLSIIPIAVYFFALGSIPLLGPDEPRYAQVAREMFERNDWITPTLGNFNWFEKPALLYWLQIVGYKLFGVSEFSARFGAAIFGLLTIFSLFVLGRFVESKRQKHSVLSTQYSALRLWLFLISASSIGLVVFSRAASFDIILTFPVTASLVSFFIFDQSEKKSFVNYYLPLASFYFFIGVSLLAKGLVGIVFPLAIVFFYYALLRKFPNKTFVFSLFWGTILSLTVAATWYVPVYLQNGWTFIDEFFIQHHFARYTSNKYQHPQPFWYFWFVLPLMTLPWTPFFLISIWKFIKNFFQRNSAKTVTENQSLSSQHSALGTFAFAWLVVPLVFFSFSGSKLAGYILPALPAALILTADYIAAFVRNNRKRETVLQILAILVFTITVTFLQFFLKDSAQHETVKNLIATADAAGFSEAKIINLSMTSHNAEFYGAKRIVRTADGKIRHFWNAVDVAEGIRREAGGKTVLVLVEHQYEYQLPEGDLLDFKKLGDNGEVAIYAVNLKENETGKSK
jgi:4-amino-4-deoxy-L-arabinose transferase-like glycosyltransferase